MQFEPTSIAGVVLLRLDQLHDERGFFARSFCRDEFARNGIPFSVDQTNISFNRTQGTVRGMHYQLAPSPEAKVVRVVRGAILDVALDLRPDSPTYLSHCAVELTADNRDALYIDCGIAHGFQTLADNTEIHYLMHGRFDAAAARGVRFDDPAFGIRWPLPVSMISAKDASYDSYQV